MVIRLINSKFHWYFIRWRFRVWMIAKCKSDKLIFVYPNHTFVISVIKMHDLWACFIFIFLVDRCYMVDKTQIQQDRQHTRRGGPNWNTYGQWNNRRNWWDILYYINQKERKLNRSYLYWTSKLHKFVNGKIYSRFILMYYFIIISYSKT